MKIGMTFGNFFLQIKVKICSLVRLFMSHHLDFIIKIIKKIKRALNKSITLFITSSQRRGQWSCNSTKNKWFIPFNWISIRIMITWFVQSLRN